MLNQQYRWSNLNPNDVIDIIAPASATSPGVLEEGVAWLQRLGLQARYPHDLIETDYFYAAPLEKQWKHFQQALYSDSKVMWCLRGGYGSMRLIPLLEKIKPPPQSKLLIGFSDITALHLYFNQKWNWPSLHARTISQLKLDWEQNKEHEDLVNLLFGHQKEITYENLIPLNDPAREKISIDGKVIGGNFRLIQSSIGTQWQVNPEEKILFIEDVAERGYSVDRMFEQLHQARLLHHGPKAIILGDFTEGLEKNGQDLVPLAIQRFAQRVKYPVLMGLPCGHAKNSNAPLPFNTPSQLILGEKSKLICQINH